MMYVVFVSKWDSSSRDKEVDLSQVTQDSTCVSDCLTCLESQFSSFLGGSVVVVTDSVGLILAEVFLYLSLSLSLCHSLSLDLSPLSPLSRLSLSPDETGNRFCRLFLCVLTHPYLSYVDVT